MTNLLEEPLRDRGDETQLIEDYTAWLFALVNPVGKEPQL